MASHYEVLDLPHSANDHEIRSAYRRSALATHPDKGGSAEAFRSVVKAFETLIDPLLRKSYDAEVKAVKAKAPWKGGKSKMSKGGRPRKPKSEVETQEKDGPSEAEKKRSPQSTEHLELCHRLIKLPQKQRVIEVRQLTEETLQGTCAV